MSQELKEDSNGESSFEFVDKKRIDEAPVRPAVMMESVPVSAAVLSPTTSNLGILNPSPAVAPTVPENQRAGSDGGLFSWVKGAVANNGGLLAKVAERAQSSVNSMITTLDPQMRDYIYSGGDIEIVVASDKEVKISPVREAFQSVFGKATVSGVTSQSVTIAAQPVGYVAGIKGAEERIQSLRKSGKLPDKQTVVAVENFLVEITQEKWFDMGVIVLNDPARDMTLHMFTQPTPLPLLYVTEAQEKTPSDYPLRWSGLAVTIGEIAGKHLQVPNASWHEALTGVTRREMVLLAAKTLAGLYKNSLGK